jgi:hypothetical protein
MRRIEVEIRHLSLDAASTRVLPERGLIAAIEVELQALMSEGERRHPQRTPLVDVAGQIASAVHAALPASASPKPKGASS